MVEMYFPADYFVDRLNVIYGTETGYSALIAYSSFTDIRHAQDWFIVKSPVFHTPDIVLFKKHGNNLIIMLVPLNGMVASNCHPLILTSLYFIAPFREQMRVPAIISSDIVILSRVFLKKNTLLYYDISTLSYDVSPNCHLLLRIDQKFPAI